MDAPRDIPIDTQGQPQASPAAPPARILQESLACVSCGYDLKGLDVTARCPECGARVDRSLRGDLLQYSSAEFVKKLHMGALLEETATLLTGVTFLVFSIILIVTEDTGALASVSHKLSGMTDVALSVVSLFGLWLFTTPEPGSSDRKPVRLRRTVRVSSAIVVASMIGTFVMKLYGFSLGGTSPFAGGVVRVPAEVGPILIGITFIVAIIVRFFAGLNFLAMMAKRIPDMTLHEKARQFRLTCLLLIFPGSLFCLIGPLIAFFIYLGIVDRTRCAMKATLKMIEANEAAG